MNELLNMEISYTPKEASSSSERGEQHYNTVPPYSPLNSKPPAPASFV
ncbi:transposase [Rhizobium sp. P44RR-XXIV]|nr:transposase [Rhizobium sp. P44RR-XXIV]